MGKTKNYFYAGEAARLSGLPPTMVDYLCRCRLAVPTHAQQKGRGHRRQYSFGDVVMLKTIKRMLDAGMSVLQLGRALRSLRRHHPEITPNSLPGNYLVTDGLRIYFRHGNHAVEELTGGQYSFAFVVELEKVKQEVLKQLEVKKSDNGKSGFSYRIRNA